MPFSQTLLLNGMYDIMEYLIKDKVIKQRKEKLYKCPKFITDKLPNNVIYKTLKYHLAETEYKHYRYFHKPDKKTLTRILDREMKVKIRDTSINNVLYNMLDKLIDDPLIYNKNEWRNILSYRMILFYDMFGTKKIGKIIGSNGRYGNNIDLVRVVILWSCVRTKENKPSDTTSFYSYNIKLRKREKDEFYVPVKDIITNEWIKNYIPENNYYLYEAKYTDLTQPLDIRVSDIIDNHVEVSDIHGLY